MDRYYDVDYLLKESGYEVWLLFDEFQQVVEKWSFIENEEPTDFIEVCNCINEKAITSIKFVFCGSDELLKQMVLTKSKSIWREKIFDVSTEPIKIGHIKPVKEGAIDEFSRMLVEDSAVQKPGLKYSTEALDTLSIYSNRVPLYAKEICNAVLESIKERCLADKFGRSCIYSYDISAATQKLVTDQNDAIFKHQDEEHKPRIAKIYDAVTKGLSEKTDKQYLWFMAQYFMKHPSSVTLKFKEYVEEMKYQLIEGENGLLDRLEIACVRGIIKGNEEQGYTFSTPFYYSAFCGTAKNFQPDSIFIQEEGTDENPQDEKISWLDEVKAIVKAQPQVNKHEIGLIIDACQNNVEVEAGMRELYGKGNEYHIGQGSTVIDKNSGTNIGTQNNVQVNVQSITNTLSGIITTSDPALLIKKIEELPRLSNYLPRLMDNAGGETISDTQISGAMDFYVADMEESLGTSFEENNERMEECWKILGFENEESFDDFMLGYGIPQCFLDSLQFAYQLDSIFTNGLMREKASQIDYSPVTIMYCKLVESMLKEYHIDVYSDALTMLDSDLSYWNKEERKRTRYKWAEVQSCTQTEKQRLTIGSFVFPICDDKKSRQNIISLAKRTERSSEDWQRHAEFIKAIKDIRNPSAHGNRDHRITLEQLENIRRILIHEEGLKRLITIVREKV